MTLNAIIPPGVTELTVNGLTQWDYGQKLKIYSTELPAIVEVHFACVGMEEAIVRACSCELGVVEAAIPDHCLQQTTPITAWIYKLGENAAETIVTITMPIIARTKPQAYETPPEEFSDKYTELIGAVNEQVETLKAGAVTVNSARFAVEADHALAADSAGEATHAGTAGNADHATTAGRADLANLAVQATVAKQVTIGDHSWTAPDKGAVTEYLITSPGVYAVEFFNTNQIDNLHHTSVIVVQQLDRDVWGTSCFIQCGEYDLHARARAKWAANELKLSVVDNNERGSGNDNSIFGVYQLALLPGILKG